MKSTTSESNLIRKTPGVLGGAARIRDTRIAVWMLVRARQLGVDNGDLIDSYGPLLTQEDLNAAWTYHQQHPQEIDADILRNERD